MGCMKDVGAVYFIHMQIINEKFDIFGSKSTLFFFCNIHIEAHSNQNPDCF